MTRLKSFILFIMCAAVAYGDCPLSLTGDVASTGVLVEPIDGGTPIVDHQSRLLLTPASTMKTVTVAAALMQRGGDYRWTTTVKTRGGIEPDGVLVGDLIIEGSGDPTLDSYCFAKEQPSFVSELKAALDARGIRRVAGRVLVADKWPDEGEVPSWELEDVPGMDGAGFYRLNWHDNVFSLSVPELKATPAIPGIKVKWVKRPTGLSAWRNAGSDRVTVYGQLGKKQARATLKLSMPDPAAALVAAIEDVIPVDNEAILGGSKAENIILQHRSPPLREVVRSLMVRSDNQMAEATLRLLARGETRARAIAVERSMLADAGVDTGYMRVADGSGLSRHNAISARTLCDILRVMAGNSDYLDSFARVGVDGTVKSLMAGVPGRENFLLKSGSMTGVVCYCGYKLDATSKRPTHVIAILINNAADAAQARKQVSAFLSGLHF